MSQIWASPFLGTDFANVTLKTDLPNTLDTLRTLFSGSLAPGSPVAGQLWRDTTLGVVKMYDGAAWQIMFPGNAIAGRIMNGSSVASLAATQAEALFCARGASEILGLVLLSETATAGSVAATTEWQFGLRNVTQAEELFSGTVGTGTVLGGVGGGELAVETEYELLVDQNGTIAKGDVLRFTITKVGTPTSPLTDVFYHLDGYHVGS